MTKLYSNWTPRASRLEGINEVVVFGIQHFVQEYLVTAFNEDFFGDKTEREFHKLRPNASKKAKLIEEYKRHCDVDTTHIEALWDLGYLPIEIKALEEGTLCPIGVPMLTITNTHDDFAWLVNYLETLISCMLWQPMTSATIAHEYKKILTKYALKTDAENLEFIQWQGHDFSMRGMSSVESAIISAMGHLLSFNGTDNIPAIYMLEHSYNAKGLIGASVPATEHSVMCMGTKEDELTTFKRLLELYSDAPVLSVVSDTWNLWDVVGPNGHCFKLKEYIMSRKGKLVIRPDSGNPVDILCGEAIDGNLNYDQTGRAYPDNMTGYDKVYRNNRKYYILVGEDHHLEWSEIHPEPKHIGLIELLWNTFGGTINAQGYRVLDPHIGAIYGDSITLERAKDICERLIAKGFASTNVVLGIGSYTYQFNTRDTFGFAMKATYGEITHKMIGRGLNGRFRTEAREIFKDPVTDDGIKKSKKGLLNVHSVEGGSIACLDGVTYAEEQEGLLKTMFYNGVVVRKTDLETIREKLKTKPYVNA